MKFKEYIKENITNTDMKKWIENESKLPELIYAHGRKGTKKPWETGFVILFSNDISRIQHYANYNNNNFYFIDLKNKKNILNATKDLNTFKKKLLVQYKNNNIENGDIEDWLTFLIRDQDKSEIEAVSEIINLMNPTDIVDSAGFWDNPNFVNWFVDNFNNIDVVITKDGAVVLNSNNIKFYSIK